MVVCVCECNINSFTRMYSLVSEICYVYVDFNSGITLTGAQSRTKKIYKMVKK